MDGVLVDFDTGLLQYGLDSNYKQLNIPKKLWSTEETEHDNKIQEVMKQLGFFYNLPAYKDTLVLWNFCRPYRPFILTARPNDVSSGDRVADEKWLWITEHLGPIPPKQFICCLRSEKKNFINSSNHKHQILVDDLEANCKDWQSVGGIGIIHTTAKNSIKELEKYVN